MLSKRQRETTETKVVIITVQTRKISIEPNLPSYNRNMRDKFKAKKNKR